MTDYISREELICMLSVKATDANVFKQPTPTWNDAVEIVESCPAADVRPVKRGKWIIDRAFGNDVMSNEQMVICSACHKGIFWGKQNFCPNCGAEMVDEDSMDWKMKNCCCCDGADMREEQT